MEEKNIPFLEVLPQCTKCDNCRLICPENAILNPNNEYTINIWACSLCNICLEICPVDAIKLSLRN